MNRKVFGALIVLILSVGTVAAATLNANPSTENGENQQRGNGDRPWRRVFLAGRAIGPTMVPLEAEELVDEATSARPAHVHRVRAAVSVHKNGKLAKGMCSVDGVRYRLNAKKDDGVWYVDLKKEDEKGSATLRWNPDSGRYEGTLELGGHMHRLFLRAIRPSALTAAEEPLG